ncbi:quinon protein alcohol dehydrogenase-like superfamily [Thamnocephalis sphaerospora]|uniref:Quinon protein alcohol dehydrogenase-like superfamily n=1 Tax=Thamnocephalis sphaerospora TaxID=78915 RepID=A0A4P9XS41_9FUNG|nr:quinon protein alcohol dehydrogenase-like superfamily [Thamnocephalis sphaerospora]|eukprot:RKP08927.1 quinon protein alcohol dehydrogenase-like superfamily [Thamnocephalis sphaerospora]
MVAAGETQVKLQLKTSYRSVAAIEAIYTGGQCAVTRDEERLFCTVNTDIYVVELSHGRKVATLEGDTEVVTSFALKPDAKHLVAASRSLQIRVWDLETYKPARAFKAHEAPVIVMDIDETSTLVATGSADSTVKVWDIDGGFCTHNFRGHSGVVSAVRFHPHAQRLWLATGADDCQVRVWDLNTRECIATLDSHTIETVGLLNAGVVVGGKPLKHQAFYTAGDKGVIRVWDYESGAVIAEQQADTNAKFTYTDVLRGHTSGQLYGITNDQNILIYQLTEGVKRVRQLVGYNDEIIDLAYLGEDETHLAVITNSEQASYLEWCAIMVTAGKDRTARIWAVDVTATTAEERFKPMGVCVGHTESIGAVAVPRRSDDFVITVSQDRTVKYWDLTEIDPEASAPEGGFKIRSRYTHQAHDKDINTVSVAPNDKLFVTGSQDKTAKVWSCVDGALVGVCKGHKRGVWCARFSPVDQVLATGSGDKTVRLWSLADFSCIKTFEGHTSSALRVEFLTAGTQLVSTGSDGLVKLWTIKTNECTETLDDHEDKIWALAVRSDEDRLITGSADSTIHIWQDFTEADREDARKEQAELVEKEQTLSNYLLKKDYKNAILLAMSLEQPHRLLKLFTEVLDQRPDGVMTDDSITGSPEIDAVIVELDQEQVDRLTCNCVVLRTAQVILHAILRTRRIEELQQLGNIKELADGLIPYTERHYARLDALLTSSYIVDYTLRAMDRHGPVGSELLTGAPAASTAGAMAVDGADENSS